MNHSVKRKGTPGCRAKVAYIFLDKKW